MTKSLECDRGGGLAGGGGAAGRGTGDDGGAGGKDDAQFAQSARIRVESTWRKSDEAGADEAKAIFFSLLAKSGSLGHYLLRNCRAPSLLLLRNGVAAVRIASNSDSRGGRFQTAPPPR